MPPGGMPAAGRLAFGLMAPVILVTALRLMLVIGCALLIALSCAPAKTVKRTGPAIALSAESWDFGTLKRGEKNAGEISVSNEGTDTLSVSLHPTCDCLEARMESDRLAPGESLPVYLTYLGDEIKDRTTKTLYVDSNDEVNSRIAVRVTGRVIKGDGPHLVVEPDPLLFDPEDPEYPEAGLELLNRGGRPLEIIDIRCFGCEVGYWEPTSLAAPGKGSGNGSGSTPEEQMISEPVYVMELRVRKLGNWTGTRWIEIETSDPVNPVKKVSILEL